MDFSEVDESIQAFFNELQEQNIASPPPAMPPPAPRKRKRTTDAVAQKPGWVPKPSEDCPIVSWVDNNNNVYAVQNPSNRGEVTLKMELYEGTKKAFMCGLFLDKDSDIHRRVNDLSSSLQNLWVDKDTGVPRYVGLTQTIAPAPEIKEGTKKKKRSPAQRGKKQPRQV